VVMTKLRTLLVATATLLAGPIMLTSACGGGDDNPGTTTGTGGTGTGTGTGTGGGGGAEQGICLLNNCSEDAHCVGCPDGRDTCLVAENRCVACNPADGTGCPDGEECSSFGICVPAGLTCPTDNDGNPTVTCTANSDCLACSPMHQVCDTDTGKCQACTETNTQHCLSSDICIDTDNDGNAETCSPKCPQTCDADNDCSVCGGPGNEAHACFNHKCAECSDTYPCAAGFECTNGVCVPPCGLPGEVTGLCDVDEDCNFCGETQGSWTCKVPVNGTSSHGVCAPPANGCSDLGTNVAVLPPPFDQYTQSCSNDGDCTQAMAGIQYNVGKQIRDLIGSNQIDLGFTQIAIQDANVFYAMPICAKVQITEDIDCGICVPCKEDSDCMPIDVDNLIVDLFAGDPLATIAGALLVDLLWGDNDDHDLNFFCQQVVAGYGACLPCGNPLAPCGQNSGGGSGNGTCDHQVCEEGGPLDPMCSQCAADVCAADSYCCGDNGGTWDSLCVSEADDECNNICTGGSGCAHDPCTAGDKLTANCSQCVTDICNDDPYCCQNSWDSLCVAKGNDTTTYPSCANACGGGCSHSPCDQGGALTDGCDACTSAVCAADAYCCDTEWDSICVNEAGMEAACSCN